MKYWKRCKFQPQTSPDSYHSQIICGFGVVIDGWQIVLKRIFVFRFMEWHLSLLSLFQECPGWTQGVADVQTALDNRAWLAAATDQSYAVTKVSEIICFSAHNYFESMCFSCLLKFLLCDMKTFWIQEPVKPSTFDLVIYEQLACLSTSTIKYLWCL